MTSQPLSEEEFKSKFKKLAERVDQTWGDSDLWIVKAPPMFDIEKFSQFAGFTFEASSIGTDDALSSFVDPQDLTKYALFGQNTNADFDGRFEILIPNKKEQVGMPACQFFEIHMQPQISALTTGTTTPLKTPQRIIPVTHNRFQEKSKKPHRRTFELREFLTSKGSSDSEPSDSESASSSRSSSPSPPPKPKAAQSKTPVKKQKVETDSDKKEKAKSQKTEASSHKGKNEKKTEKNEKEKSAKKEKKETKYTPKKETKDTPKKETKDTPQKETKDTLKKETKDTPKKETKDTLKKETKDTPKKGTSTKDMSMKDLPRTESNKDKEKKDEKKGKKEKKEKKKKVEQKDKKSKKSKETEEKKAKKSTKQDDNSIIKKKHKSGE